MIKLENLTKVYNDKNVVDNLSLILQAGVITGFLGPNGAGKSTTMKMIISLVHPTNGQVSIDGQAYHTLEEPIKKEEVKGIFDYIIEFYLDYYYFILPGVIVICFVGIYIYNKKHDLF